MISKWVMPNKLVLGVFITILQKFIINDMYFYLFNKLLK